MGLRVEGGVFVIFYSLVLEYWDIMGEYEVSFIGG